MPSLSFGPTPPPRPVEVTLFFTPREAETPTPEPAPETATPQPSATIRTLTLPTTAPTLLPELAPTELPTLTLTPQPEALPTIAPSTQTPLPTVVVAEIRVITVLVTVTVPVSVPVSVPVTVIATSPPATATPRTPRTATAAPTATSSIKTSLTPTRAVSRILPTPVAVATVDPTSYSRVLTVDHKSGIRSDPWGMPYNEDGCTQFDDRKPGRKVAVDFIVRKLDPSASSWSAQFYQGVNPFPTCISEPFVDNGILRERNIPARGYPLPFDAFKTIAAFVPEGQTVTRLNVLANGKAELCFALNGGSATQIACGS